MIQFDNMKKSRAIEFIDTVILQIFYTVESILSYGWTWNVFFFVGMKTLSLPCDWFILGLQSDSKNDTFDYFSSLNFSQKVLWYKIWEDQVIVLSRVTIFHTLWPCGFPQVNFNHEKCSGEETRYFFGNGKDVPRRELSLHSPSILKWKRRGRLAQKWRPIYLWETISAFLWQSAHGAAVFCNILEYLLLSEVIICRLELFGSLYLFALFLLHFGTFKSILGCSLT